jgi:hypothetical protein
MSLSDLGRAQPYFPSLFLIFIPDIPGPLYSYAYIPLSGEVFYLTVLLQYGSGTAPAEPPDTHTAACRIA